MLTTTKCDEIDLCFKVEDDSGVDWNKIYRSSASLKWEKEAEIQFILYFLMCLSLCFFKYLNFHTWSTFYTDIFIMFPSHSNVFLSFSFGFRVFFSFFPITKTQHIRRGELIFFMSYRTVFDCIWGLRTEHRKSAKLNSFSSSSSSLTSLFFTKQKKY